MPRKDIIDAIRKYTEPFRVAKGKDFRLKDFDPGDTLDLKMDKEEAAELLQRGSDWLAMEQDILYAQDSWSVLLVFQAMDAAGKDGTIKHVMSRVNPQGCEVHSFKQPSVEELSHDFLWRYSARVPQRGRIGIFNRSYYEEVLVVRVHQALLEAQKMPPELVDKGIWDERLADIARIRGLSDAPGRGDPQVLPQPVAEGAEEALHGAPRQARRRTGSSPLPTCASAGTGTTTCTPTRRRSRPPPTKSAPWFVVPADNKWFTPAGRRGGDRRRGGEARPQVSEDHGANRRRTSPRRVRS